MRIVNVPDVQTVKYPAMLDVIFKEDVNETAVGVVIG
nr:MAG TPA: hypothetical protein [Caudoviricetes sp.]